jgi:hypothetical protein
MKRLRSKLTYSNVISTFCLFLLVGGGTAVAAGSFAKESLPPKAIKKESIGPGKLTPAAKAALVGPAGPKGATGSAGPAGPQGPAGSARAYGSTINGDGGLDPARSKNATVRKAATGTYCITPGAGIDPASATLLVTTDYQGPVGAKAITMFRSKSAVCTANELEVKTWNDGVAVDGFFTFLIP